MDSEYTLSVCVHVSWSTLSCGAQSTQINNGVQDTLSHTASEDVSHMSQTNQSERGALVARGVDSRQWKPGCRLLCFWGAVKFGALL